MRTLEAFRAMGIDIEHEGDNVIVNGKGLKGLMAPDGPLYMGNSGTSMRIISGILAGQKFGTVLTGDESLSGRPMKRVVDPLRLMGAEITTSEGGLPPIKINTSEENLRSIEYATPVPSAQVKSCVLCAGLYADGTTSVTESIQSRDHTERMLEYFSADIKKEGRTTKISGRKELEPKDIDVPGDISSAAFFIVAALLVAGSDVVLKNVGLNPTRVGIITVLERMGADIEILNKQDGFEPAGDIRIRHSRLNGTTVKSEEIPFLIDEGPVLIIAAVMAKGRTEIHGISELKVKESDRVKSMTENLEKLGVAIREEGNTLIVDGGCKSFASAALESFGDHRIAMSMAVAALVSDAECVIKDISCVETSYPGFLSDLEKINSTYP